MAISNKQARKILKIEMYKSGYGTHHYYVTYTGEWDDKALINAVDCYNYSEEVQGEVTDEVHEQYKDKKCNFGGYVELISNNDGVKKARLGVYYD